MQCKECILGLGLPTHVFNFPWACAFNINAAPANRALPLGQMHLESLSVSSLNLSRWFTASNAEGGLGS